jgi:hypothetical protein
MPEPLTQALQIEYDVSGLEDAMDAIDDLDDAARLSFGAGYVSNIDSVLEWYADQLPDRLIWLLRIANDTDYARYLNDRLGYWVMNDRLAVQLTARRLRQLVRSGDPNDDEAIEEALTKAAEDILDAYTRVVGRKNTRGREMGPPRPKHKGQWADDTITLARNFTATLVGDGEQEVASTEDYDPPFTGS